MWSGDPRRPNIYPISNPFTTKNNSTLVGVDVPRSRSYAGSSTEQTSQPVKLPDRTSFHLLIPATEKNPRLCKTLLSASILKYPPPTLINFNKSFTGQGPDNGTHAGKIRGIFDFLSDSQKVQPGDLVLIVDGYDVWFQLPPEILLQRYHQLLEDGNKKLLQEFGTYKQHKAWEPEEPKTVPRYTQKVLFGADKLCWPNQPEDHACASVPSSTLSEKAWGNATDMDGYTTRPRFLNSGGVIGLARDVKAICEQATFMVEEENAGLLGDQYVFGAIFGEQEYHRNLVRETNREAEGGWKHWLAAKVGLGGTPQHGNGNGNGNSNTSAAVSQPLMPTMLVEYGMGLDYEMSLFQTMTHSHADVDFFQLNSTARLQAATNDIVTERHLTFLQEARDIPPPLPAKHHDQVPTSRLDNLPDRLGWLDVPVAVNVHVPSVPVLLHFNGDKSYLDTWWARMWYHPYARTLLRQRTRASSSQTTTTTTSTSPSWDDRGGTGGFWTDKGHWLSWRDVCGGFEEEVFEDGLGEWGKEDGEKKVFNEWGELVQDDEIGV
ncbi:MAG: hypothetical protein M1816_004207 [Peltula sp. TS41687]|nr:MAG: hypothetical protein M1816_004207 [Peltula sp. TS41687]